MAVDPVGRSTHCCSPRNPLRIVARAENAVLKKKVEELSARVKVLTVENESLKAEVEIYRAEAALPNFSNLALGKSDSAMDEDADTNNMADDFVRAGDGVYAKENEFTFRNVQDSANPLCCVLSPDDVMLAVGGANGRLALCPWGAVYGASETPESVVAKAVQLELGAPVISCAFAHSLRGVLAAGCMDGSVHLIHYQSLHGGKIEAKLLSLPKAQHHRKYVRTVAWSPTSSLFASSSADGTIRIHKVDLQGGMVDDDIEFEAVPVTSLHLEGAVEAMVFSKEFLICYNRGTPHLSYFEVSENFKQTKINLNAGETGTANHSDHVSYTIMDLAIFDDKYLAAATDASRIIVMDLRTGKQIRNLYGHQNDEYSQPKLAWSSNGAYIYGNSQHESVLYVWDVASSQMVQKLEGHGQPIRTIHSSNSDNLVVTSGFDKDVKFWFAPQSQ